MAASRKLALKANRSLGARRSRTAARSDGSGSHEPCAATTTPARSSTSSSAPSSARTRSTKRPALPAIDCSAHGCSSVAPAASAAAASKVSRCSRPSARPQRCAPSPTGSGAWIVRPPCMRATRRSSAPASRAKSAPTPSASSSSRLLAATHSPHTLRRGNAWRSISATDQPARAKRIAALAPAGPAPTMATSKLVLIAARAGGRRSNA